MPPIVIAAGIAAASSVAAAKVASNAAKGAAKTQSAATDRAAALQAQSTREAQAYTQQAMAPYMSLGQFGMGLLTMPGQGPMQGPGPQVATPAPIPQLPPQGGYPQAQPRPVRMPLNGFGTAPQPMVARPMANGGGGYGMARFGRYPAAQ